MTITAIVSRRRAELLDLLLDYSATHGLSDVTLRPLAGAVGSSPRMLRYHFGSPAKLLICFPAIRDEDTLIARPPVSIRRTKRLTKFRLKDSEEFKKGKRVVRTTAGVVDLARCNIDFPDT